jgi:hypothetical protein
LHYSLFIKDSPNFMICVKHIGEKIRSPQEKGDYGRIRDNTWNINQMHSPPTSWNRASKKKIKNLTCTNMELAWEAIFFWKHRDNTGEKEKLLSLRVIVARVEWKESADKVKKPCNFYCHCKRIIGSKVYHVKERNFLISIINPSIYCIIRTARLRHLNKNMMT